MSSHLKLTPNGNSIPKWHSAAVKRTAKKAGKQVRSNNCSDLHKLLIHLTTITIVTGARCRILMLRVGEKKAQSGAVVVEATEIPRGNFYFSSTVWCDFLAIGGHLHFNNASVIVVWSSRIVANVENIQYLVDQLLLADDY